MDIVAFDQSVKELARIIVAAQIKGFAGVVGVVDFVIPENHSLIPLATVVRADGRIPDIMNDRILDGDELGVVTRIWLS